MGWKFWRIRKFKKVRLKFIDVKDAQGDSGLVLTSAEDEHGQPISVGNWEHGEEPYEHDMVIDVASDIIKSGHVIPDEMMDDWVGELPIDLYPVAMELVATLKRGYTMREFMVRIAERYEPLRYTKETMVWLCKTFPGSAKGVPNILDV